MGEYRRLNVLIGLEGLALGGCPINAIDLARALRTRGHTLNVFAIDERVKVSLEPYAERSGFQVTRLPAVQSTLRRALQIRRLADRCSADVVHVFAPWMSMAAAGSILGRRRVVMVTNWMMENVSYTPQHLPLIVGTRSMQTEAQLGHRSPVHLMEPPVDLVTELADVGDPSQFRADLGIDPNDTVAVIVSRVAQHMKAEGIRNAVEAVGRINSPDLSLVIVGDGDAYGEIVDMANKVNAGLGRNAVITTGALDDPRVAYRAADLVLGMGGSAIRAMAHAKPVIVLGVDGFAEIFESATCSRFLEHGFYGVGLSDPDPVAHLASLIESLLREPRRRSLGSFGHDLVTSRFSLDAAADTLVEWYEAELAGRLGVVQRTLSGLGTLGRAQMHNSRVNLQRRLRSRRPELVH